MRRTAGWVAAAVVAAGLATTAPGQAVPGGAPATVHAVGDQADQRRYPAFDARGVRVRHALWTVTEAGGNCCEVFVASTPSGRLLEFGGTYPMFSDDRGVSWQQVRPATPVLNGEGAVAAAPGGDIVGVGWDAYTGDHLQAFKYDGEARTWTYADVPLHEPLHDRPWIAVVPGTFALPGGGTSDYATVVRANYLSGLRETFLVSVDGLTYVPAADSPLRTGAATRDYLARSWRPALDYAQPHRESRMTPLADGRLLNVHQVTSGTCPGAALTWPATWACLSIPDHPLVPGFVVDSRGWLHELVVENGTIVYRLSADGGETWRDATLDLPDGGAFVDAATQLDHKANGAIGVAAVAAHVLVDETSQDMVFKVDVSTPTPRFTETLYVGLGDVATGQGLGAADRFDFASLAILPDGTVALAFRDSTSESPALAVEVREPRCARGRRCP